MGSSASPVASTSVSPTRASRPTSASARSCSPSPTSTSTPSRARRSRPTRPASVAASSASPARSTSGRWGRSRRRRTTTAPPARTAASGRARPPTRCTTTRPRRRRRWCLTRASATARATWSPSAARPTQPRSSSRCRTRRTPTSGWAETDSLAPSEGEEIDPSAPDWVSGTVYSEGDEVVYQGSHYKARRTTAAPATTPNNNLDDWVGLSSGGSAQGSADEVASGNDSANGAPGFKNVLMGTTAAAAPAWAPSTAYSAGQDRSLQRPSLPGQDGRARHRHGHPDSRPRELGGLRERSTSATTSVQLAGQRPHDLVLGRDRVEGADRFRRDRRAHPGHPGAGRHVRGGARHDRRRRQRADPRQRQGRGPRARGCRRRWVRRVSAWQS